MEGLYEEHGAKYLCVDCYSKKMPATNQTAVAANNPSASSSSKSSFRPKVNTAVKNVSSASLKSKKSSKAVRKLSSAVAIGASASALASTKSSLHPQMNDEKSTTKNSSNKRLKKSKQNEDSNETTEFLMMVSRGKNAEVSPAAKEAFRRSVSLSRHKLTISPVEERNNKDLASTSEDDDSIADSVSCASSSSSESSEMTLDEACVDSSLIHGDFDNDVDDEILDKVQDDWDFEKSPESQFNTGSGSAEVLKNGYVKSLQVQGGLHIHYSLLIQSMLQEENMESKIFFLFITKSYFGAVRKWTLGNIGTSTASRQLPKKLGLSDSLFFAYVGLELGMSFCQFNRIKDYWSNTIFSGHPIFKETMSRNVLLS